MSDRVAAAIISVTLFDIGMHKPEVVEKGKIYIVQRKVLQV